MGGTVGKIIGTDRLYDSLTGKTAQRQMEEQARAQREQFAADQARAEQERMRAEAVSRRRIADMAEGRATGRASTLLTGPEGLEDEEGARRRLLGG